MSDETTRAPSTGRRGNDDTMTRAIEALEKAVDALTRTVQTLQIAIFGRWDEDTNEQVPGINTQINALSGRLSKVETLLKRGAWAVGSIGAIVVLKAIGVPTEEVGKFVTQLLSHVGG